MRIFVHMFSVQKRTITENHVAVAEKKQHAHLPLKKTGFLNNSNIKVKLKNTLKELDSDN